MGSNSSAKTTAGNIANKTVGLGALNSELTAYKTTENIAINLAKGKGTSALATAAKAGSKNALVTALGNISPLYNIDVLLSSLATSSLIS